MKALALLFLFMLPAEAQVYSAGTNFTVDLLGKPDNRPDTWGTADYSIKTIQFTPPPGHRVRILRVYGDMVFWPITPFPHGKFAGVLLGLQTTAPEGSVRMDWGADNTMLYIQDATGGEARRSAFDYDVKAGGLLQPDHKLLVKMAVWLNNTGSTIHIEPSFVMVYQFEKTGPGINDINKANQPITEYNRAVVFSDGWVWESKPGFLRIPPRLEVRP